MKEIGYIYLSWRKGTGHRRHIVGVIKNSATKGITFSYLKKEIEKAKEEGFAPYTEFPEIDKIYKDNVLEIFAQRLTKSERPDIKDFYSFWEIKTKQKDDKYHILAHTMGLSPTDNFEFLADYHPIKGMSFITDLAGLSKMELSPDLLLEGDDLYFEKEPQNKYDPYAVKVFKGDKEIGYIKKIHSKVFHKRKGPRIKLTVKAIDKNGVIKRVFVKVSF